MTYELLIGQRGTYIETQSGSYVLLSGAVAPEFIKQSQLAEQTWIVPPWDNSWIEAGYGVRQVYFHLGQGKGCRNVFLDDKGCVWIAGGSYVWRSAPLQNQTVKWNKIESRRLQNVTTNSGRVALGKKEGTKYYFITARPAGGVYIWRISDNWEDDQPELVAERTEEFWPYDFHYDGRFNQWVCPSYDKSSSGYYEYYILSLTGEILDHYSAPYPGQQIAIDAYGRYWINGRGTKYVGIFEPGTLNNISWYYFAPASQIRGIGETITGDIVCADRGTSQVIIIEQESDYKNYYVVRTNHKTYKAAPAGDAVVAISIDGNRIFFVYPELGTVKTIYMRACNRPYGQGDPSLKRYKIWHWNWSPNASALIKYILGY